MFLSTAPAASPASLSPVTVTFNSITVQWEKVNCFHHNGEITGYRIMAKASGEDNRTVNVKDSNGRTATVSGLNSNTLYTISVAAVNSAGTGPATSINIETPGKYICGLSFEYSPKNNNPNYNISLPIRWIHCVCLNKFSNHLMGTG